jgi:DNA-binding transcriptional regulator YhcF (GntR family)
MTYNGWIKLQRQILENPLWTSERFSRGQAWIDLILRANHKPNLIRIRGNEVRTERGELCWSIKSLANIWQWNERTVNKYLSLLKKEGMIQYRKSNVTTVISILKYDYYQGSTEQNTEQSTEQSTQALQNRVHTNKNVKNVKKDKNDKNKETKSLVTETVTVPPLSIYPLEVNSESETPLSEKQLPAKIHELQTWISNNAPNVNKLKEPLTYEQSERILAKYTDDSVHAILLQMHNYKPLTQKSISANLTLLKWIEKEKDTSKLRTTDPEDPFFGKYIPGKLRALTGFTEAWKAWILYMKEKENAIVESTAKYQLEFLSTSTDPIGIIKNAIEKSWKGLYEVNSGYKSQAPERPQKPIWES